MGEEGGDGKRQCKLGSITILGININGDFEKRGEAYERS